MRTAELIVSSVVALLVVFYVLSATYNPLESAGIKLQSSLGADITGEELGTANSTGDLYSVFTDYSPIESSSETVYANGTASGSWTNASYNISYSTGEVTVYSTGTNPSTANALITIDYNKEPQITGIKTMSSLPGVAILLFVLLTILGIVVMAIGRGKL